jgi:hypothetical protein
MGKQTKVSSLTMTPTKCMTALARSSTSPTRCRQSAAPCWSPDLPSSAVHSTDEYMVLLGDPVAYKKWFDGGASLSASALEVRGH